jgi:hypothetical protein
LETDETDGMKAPPDRRHVAADQNGAIKRALDQRLDCRAVPG